jgi:outer membrane protein
VKRVLTVCILWCTIVFALADEGQSIEEKPLWELGLFNGIAALPNYRGSDETTLYAAPLPFLIYRGLRLKANRHGVQQILATSDSLELTLALRGRPPDFGKTEAREGMDDLDPLLEFGPLVRWHLLRDQDQQLYVSMSIRQVVSMNTDSFNTGNEGAHGEMKFIYRNDRLFNSTDWRFGINAGIDIGGTSYHDFLYSVDPQDAKLDRAAYDADAGYGGFFVSANLMREVSPSWSIGGLVQWDNLAGSSFRNSPLVRAENNLTVAVALVYTIARSKRLVARPGF